MTSLFSCFFFCCLFFYLSLINEGENVSSESYVYVRTSLELSGIERFFFFFAALESILSQDKKEEQFAAGDRHSSGRRV